MNNQIGKGVLGNSIDIVVEQCDPSVEIRADVRVEEFESKRLWGQILNCKGEAVPNTLIKLAKIICINGKKQYKGIAHTVTDCEGFYQFDVCAEEDACYKIIVNKAITGPESIIETGGGNCNACGIPTNPEQPLDEAYKPCHEYPDQVKPYQRCECGQKPPCPQPMPQPCPQPMPHPCPQPMPHPCPQPMPQPCSQPMPQPCPQPMPHLCPQPMPHPCPQPMPHPCPQPMPHLCQGYNRTEQVVEGTGCMHESCSNGNKRKKTHYATYTK